MTDFPGSPADVATAFIEAFGRQDTTAVADLLAEDVVFTGPRATVTGAAAVAEAIGGFARAVTAVKIISVLGDDEQAVVMYDMETGPFGTLRAVDRLTVRDGRITSDTLVFDTHPVRAAAPPPESLTMIRYTPRPGAADTNQRLVEDVFAQLHAERPDDVRYLVLRLDDGGFVHLVANDREPSPLVDLPAFMEFQRAFGDRVPSGPERGTARVVGAYRMAG